MRALRHHHWPITAAYQWLCKSRKHFPPNADIWHLRFHWQAERKHLLKLLNTGSYTFEPVKRCQTRDGKTIHLWSSRDALVLKALSLMLAKPLQLSSHCTHIKNHGGMKATIVDVERHLPYYKFVLKTDVKDYYASIDHEVLLEQLACKVKDRFLMNLLSQYLKRTVDCGGVYRDIRRGIARGCALSPILGAFYLQALDMVLGNSGLYYVRYMDDILIMASTRWKLRRAVATLQTIFAELKVKVHPDKTFIGRVEKGFDFLGYHFSREGLSLAAKTISNSLKKLHRLYEQKKTAPEGAAILGVYWRRWCGWTRGGLDLNVSIHTGTDYLASRFLLSKPTNAVKNK